ncbi:uncharacterized protein LOC134874938 [Eleginops maclovinus]|uniref:uncharacterized protein LOC134874938 n=1 Tax=Eleginops maclovinus TaxID=56733 RepID=UPI003080DC14
MDAAREQSGTELLEVIPFSRNAEAIINKMLELNDSCQDKATQLVEEILHSIFFLGKIHTPPYSPEMILDYDREMLGLLRVCYPRPFKFYSSQLPRRTPFSCVLDMVVFLNGQEKENKIIDQLRMIISELGLKKHGPLVSSTICVSQKTGSTRYYGVSMSTSGRIPGRIMVAASCLSGYWDSYVAGAVMSFNPSKRKKQFFDGTIKLPQSVSWQASSLHDEGAKMPPCNSCLNMFCLENIDAEFAPGNCAEVESVSNMFKMEEEVREQSRPRHEKFTADNREKAKKSLEADLKNNLKSCKLTYNKQFFTP